MTGTYRQSPPLHPQVQTPILDFINPSTHSTSIAYRRLRTFLFVSFLDVAVEWVEDKWLYFMRSFINSSNNGIPWNERLESKSFVVSLVGLLFILSLMYPIYVPYIFCPPPLPLPLRANPSLIFASVPIHLFTRSTNPSAAPKEEVRRGRRKVVRKDMIFPTRQLSEQVVELSFRLHWRWSARGNRLPSRCRL